MNKKDTDNIIVPNIVNEKDNDSSSKLPEQRIVELREDGNKLIKIPEQDINERINKLENNVAKLQNTHNIYYNSLNDIITNISKRKSMNGSGKKTKRFKK